MMVGVTTYVLQIVVFTSHTDAFLAVNYSPVLSHFAVCRSCTQKYRFKLESEHNTRGNTEQHREYIYACLKLIV